MSDNAYWYGGMGGASLVSDLPAQAIPSKKKTEKWKKATLDALERTGLKQYRENIRFADYYRMSEGKVSFREVAELIPQLREVSGLMDKFKLPTTIQHYDLLGIIVNYLQSVMVENKDKFHPTDTGEVFSNERNRKMTELLHQYVMEQWNKELQIKLIENGLDPNRSEFASQEEQQAYLQQVQQASEAMTPPEIKNYMEKSWKSAGVQWAEATLEADEQRFRMNEIDRDCIYDFLHTGRWFQHFYVKYDSYAVEKWHPINTFFSQTVDIKYPQYGEYIGRIHFYTPSDFINKKGHHFSEEQKREILNASDDDEIESGSNLRLDNAMEHGFQERRLVPFENYYDHKFLEELEEQTGVPLATRTVYKKDGTSETFNDFLPKSQRRNSNVNRYARFLREDLNLRTDMIMVTEAYWRSYQKVGLLTYVTPDGRVDTEIITDELLKPFLKENGIEEVHDISLEDALKKKTPNTVIWDYKPEIWQGEKATTSSTRLGEDLYYNIKPLEYQIKGDSNVFDLQLPVAGVIDKNPADKIMPWQFAYNIECNKQRDMQEKALGIFFLFDINFLPSDIKGYGDTETSLLNMMRIVKDTSMFGVDLSKSNNPQGSQFNQFGVHDLTFAKQIQESQMLAEHYKNKAYEQFGVSFQELSKPASYVTATGVDEAVHTTQSQTDYLYESFSNGKSRSLEIHLALAQWAQSNGKDLTVEYTKSDLSNAFVEFSQKDMIPLRRLGIMAISDRKRRREMEQMKQYMLTQNTHDADSLELSSIISSDSMIALMDVARLERKRKEVQRQMEMEHERQLQQDALKGAQDAEEKTWRLAEISKEADRKNKISLELLKAQGRAADNESTVGGLDYLALTADNALKREGMNNDYDLQLRELDVQIEENKQKYKETEQTFALQLKELEEKRKKRESDERIALINKN